MTSLFPTMAGWVLIFTSLAGCGGVETQGGEGGGQLLLRVEPFTVPPSTGPVTHVVVRNTGEGTWSGTVELKLPEEWSAAPERQLVTLEPGESRRVPFTVEKAVDRESNVYSVEAVAVAGAYRTSREQDVFCASAPYFAPAVDGRLDEWGDAIPVAFEEGGRRTVVRTYWNQRELFLAVEVDEERLLARGPGGQDGQGGATDAVQVAIASRGASTGGRPEEEASRFELLFLPGAAIGGPGKCFLLATPGIDLRETQVPKELESLLFEDARVEVSRIGTITAYECSVPFSLLREAVRPTVGREFLLSLLVHDPDGTGIRDLGRAAGLWSSSRSRFAWSAWKGARWEEDPPFDSKVEWGLCSSKH